VSISNIPAINPASMSSRKPVVALICSNPRFADSDESLLLSQYLGGLLHIGGYSRVRLVSLPSAGTSKAKEKTIAVEDTEAKEKTISVIPVDKTAPTVISESEDFCLRASTDTLAECHVIIVCVSPQDTTRTGELLANLPKKGDSPIGVFTLQHGSKNFDKLSAR